MKSEGKKRNIFPFSRPNHPKKKQEALQILLQADALSDKSAKLMKEFGATGPNLESVPVPQLLDMASHLSEVQS